MKMNYLSILFSFLWFTLYDYLYYLKKIVVESYLDFIDIVLDRFMKKDLSQVGNKNYKLFKMSLIGDI